METERRERKISEIVERCEVYWVLSNVPRAKVEEMKLELQTHLREAEWDGKPPEAVVGGDFEGFADAWAHENRVRKSPGARLLDFAAATAVCATALLTTRHVLDWTATFSIDLWTVIIVLILAAVSLALLSRSLARRSLSFGPWWRKLLLGFGVGAFVVGLSLVWSLTESTALNPELVTWPWHATLILAVIAFALFWFQKNPTAPENRRGARR